ncbi:MAG: copper amine oxidase N-terminal domain-containing protein [Defluviitaleaceae bacterium]|nr:copper amine oxidase N-terminal domain-containing protein [Defluviitaleaceae bacterium]
MKTAKKMLSVIMAIVLITGAIVPKVAYANEVRIKSIFGEIVEVLGPEPVIVDGRVLAPIRGLFDLEFHVHWDPYNERVTLIDHFYDFDEFIFTMGSYTFTLNGVIHNLDVPAQLINGVPMLPLRSIIEGLGFYVDWDEATRTVVLSERMDTYLTNVAVSHDEEAVRAFLEAFEGYRIIRAVETGLLYIFYIATRTVAAIYVFENEDDRALYVNERVSDFTATLNQLDSHFEELWVYVRPRLNFIISNELEGFNHYLTLFSEHFVNEIFIAAEEGDSDRARQLIYGSENTVWSINSYLTELNIILYSNLIRNSLPYSNQIYDQYSTLKDIESAIVSTVGTLAGIIMYVGNVTQLNNAEIFTADTMYIMNRHLAELRSLLNEDRGLNASDLEIMMTLIDRIEWEIVHFFEYYLLGIISAAREDDLDRAIELMQNGIDFAYENFDVSLLYSFKAARVLRLRDAQHTPPQPVPADMYHSAEDVIDAMLYTFARYSTLRDIDANMMYARSVVNLIAGAYRGNDEAISEKEELLAQIRSDIDAKFDQFLNFLYTDLFTERSDVAFATSRQGLNNLRTDVFHYFDYYTTMIIHFAGEDDFDSVIELVRAAMGTLDAAYHHLDTLIHFYHSNIDELIVLGAYPLQYHLIRYSNLRNLEIAVLDIMRITSRAVMYAGTGDYIGLEEQAIGLEDQMQLFYQTLMNITGSMDMYVNLLYADAQISYEELNERINWFLYLEDVIFDRLYYYVIQVMEAIANDDIDEVMQLLNDALDVADSAYTHIYTARN